MRNNNDVCLKLRKGVKAMKRVTEVNINELEKLAVIGGNDTVAIDARSITITSIAATATIISAGTTGDERVDFSTCCC